MRAYFKCNVPMYMSEEMFAIFDEDEEEQKADDTTKKYLTFISDELQYAIDVENVQDIITSFSITMLPMAPSFVKGVMNLRGQITPLVDIRQLMGRPDWVEDEQSCIVVLEVDEIPLGILVDTVCRVVDLNPDEISVSPHNAQNELVNGIINIDGVTNLIFDCEKLVLMHVG